MSKVDALRAMREARYAQRQARPATTSTTAAKAAVAPEVKPPAQRRTTAKAKAADNAPATDEALCGHKAISGRTCTREQGHSAKSHRYS